jgi:hypothetical protein
MDMGKVFTYHTPYLVFVSSCNILVALQSMWKTLQSIYFEEFSISTVESKKKQSEGSRKLRHPDFKTIRT